MVAIKDRIKKALADRNMHPIELSEKTGISKASISQYMSGRAKPKGNRIFLIAKALDVNEAWLLGYDVEQERKKLSSSEAEKDFDLIKKFSMLKESDKIIITSMIDRMLEGNGD